jgi:Flp pilus assembly protein TadB
MDVPRQTRRHPRPPVLDMTPEGEFRDQAAEAPPGAAPRTASALDRFLVRLTGVALLLGLAAAGLLLVALAVVFIGLLLPVVLVAGAIGAASLWWRMRRLRRDGAGGGGTGFQRMHMVVLRR